MKTKNILITFAIIIASFSNAQIKLFVNDKQIGADSTINFNDIKSIKLQFKSKANFKTIGNGKAQILIQHFNKNGAYVNVQYVYEVEGSTACEALINNNDKQFKVARQEDRESDFRGFAGPLYKYWSSALTYDDMHPIKIKISVIYMDKIGYDNYGSPIDVVEPFSFKINR